MAIPRRGIERFQRIHLKHQIVAGCFALAMHIHREQRAAGGAVKRSQRQVRMQGDALRARQLLQRLRNRAPAPLRAAAGQDAAGVADHMHAALIARLEAIAGRLKALTFLDLHQGVVDRVLERERNIRRSGPIAESVLRDVGTVASNIA